LIPEKRVFKTKDRNTGAQCRHCPRSGIQFRQMQKAICTETARGGGPKSASWQPSATTGITAGNCQSACSVIRAVTSFAAKSDAGSGAGSRLVGTAVHSQPPVDSDDTQQPSAAGFGAQQVAAVQQQLAVTAV
jgi:hypothetical protein